jgi:hypothetical protein
MTAYHRFFTAIFFWFPISINKPNDRLLDRQYILFYQQEARY